MLGIPRWVAIALRRSDGVHDRMLLRTRTAMQRSTLRAREIATATRSMSNAVSGKAVGGSLNDAFVSGVVGGLARYHEFHGEEVDDLRMVMPINVREASAALGGTSVADLDRNGRPDVIVGYVESRPIVYFNDGPKTFHAVPFGERAPRVVAWLRIAGVGTTDA